MNWKYICHQDELENEIGTAALVNGQQIALFRIDEAEHIKIFALSNWDPFGKANVLSRGIVGDLNGQPVIASPLYKQHFNLENGHCLEDENCILPTWQTKIENGDIFVAVN
ncbi:nitrite reductase small subunit NirD [Marinomonas mediterranea]|uniref:nitrite reductase small subunit NirD n=1 Tax=Marinomonas mediterranea TaxID=119864 RepID=UPI00234A64B2|nr:nitrite reductase small subunit NirD [Marinomonas mediterranea]WCN10975.1 nitrite reductase small subunit NirD [Marinomonas mediterranea]